MLLILDSMYNQVSFLPFVNDTSYRISKNIKHDIESATLITTDKDRFLYALGSFSSKTRQRLFHFPLSTPDSFVIIELPALETKLSTIRDINIEGLAFTGSSFVMANRANLGNRINNLVISSMNIHDPHDSPVSIIKLIMDSSTVKGLSGLYYHLERDILFFTASEEETTNAIEDGLIKDSYLGWIKSFSDKMDEKEITPDQLVKLSDTDKAFTREKIESVCVEQVQKNNFILHLVSDNDKGQSKIFKISLRL